MPDYRVQLKMAPTATTEAVPPTLAVDVAAPDHRQAVETAEAFVARDNGPGTFLAFTVVALRGDSVEDGYDTAQETAAKHVVLDAITRHLEHGDGTTAAVDADLEGLADTVVEALMAAGIAIPDRIVDPHGASENAGEARIL